MNSHKHWKQVGGILLSTSIVIVPILVTLLLPVVLFDSSLLQFNLKWNDEIQYWQEINTFRVTGFNGGYFSVEELTSNADFSHFGTHGPIYPMFMGLLARMGGWTETSGPIYNLIFISLGILIFLWAAKPGLRARVYLLFFVAFLYPVLLYIPSTMQESFNQGLAFMVSGMLIKLLSFNGRDLPTLEDHASKRAICEPHQNKLRIPNVLIVFSILFVLFASLIRVTWSLIFLPLYYILWGSGNTKRNLILLFFSIASIAIMAFLYSYWTSPFPDSFIFYLLHTETFSITSVFSNLAKHTSENFLNFITISEDTNLLEILQRYQILVLILFIFISVLKKKSLFLVPLYILISGVALTIIIYDVSSWRDYRTLSPFLIIAVLFMIKYSHFKSAQWILTAFILANILFFPSFLSTYQNEFHSNRFSIEENQPIEVLENLKYQANQSPWCNSILTTRIFTEDLLSLPAGIGVNIILDEKRIVTPVKSHYLLVPPGMIAGLVENNQVVAVESLEDVTLYKQIDDHCNE